jgi:hypothetical protein
MRHACNEARDDARETSLSLAAPIHASLPLNAGATPCRLAPDVASVSQRRPCTSCAACTDAASRFEAELRALLSGLGCCAACGERGAPTACCPGEKKKGGRAAQGASASPAAHIAPTSVTTRVSAQKQATTLNPIICHAHHLERASYCVGFLHAQSKF